MGKVAQLVGRLEAMLARRHAYKFIVREWAGLDDIRQLGELLASTRYLRTLRPALLERPAGKRILVVAPHPDDEMIGPGGTLIKAIRGGAAVHVVYLTEEPGERGRKRREDTLAVSKSVGYATEFLPFSANALPLTAAVGHKLAESIRRFAPDTIFVPFLSDDHPDHRKASALLALACEGASPQPSAEVWAYQVYSAVLPNVVVDITEAKDAKAAAIRLWAQSAMQSRDWAHFALGLNAYNSRLLAGDAAPRFAEAFFVVPLAEYLRFCAPYVARATAGEA